MNVVKLGVIALSLLVCPALALAEGAVPGKTATQAHIHNLGDGTYTRALALPRGAQLQVLYGLPLTTPSVLQIRVPPGFVIPYHHHPLDEILSLVTGTVDIELAGKKMRIRSGGMMVMPANVPHLARCVGVSECILRLHPPGPWAIIYENPADDPRKTAQR
jgi:quercetin dioxygenase-like cupin family protein